MIVEAMLDRLELPAVASARLAQLVDRARPCVVQVRSGWRGAGAGIIWRTDGHILTNYHVIAASQRGAAIPVVLADGRTFAAQVVDHNAALDLALLKIAAPDLPVLPIGDSTRLRVGELVFAIGHPWGQTNFVTAGIVSGLAIALRDNQHQIPYIQSDVRLAPGNSGGPLLNVAGQVVGINAMIAGGDLSVAIPIHVALERFLRV